MMEISNGYYWRGEQNIFFLLSVLLIVTKKYQVEK